MLRFIFRTASVVLGCVLLTSCASSGYKAFYTPAEGATPEEIARLRAAPPPETPKLERSAPVSADQILSAYAQRGYALIGYSMFNSGARESEVSALEQGRLVGADIVLVLNPSYTGSVTTVVPITTPTSTTSYTTGSATAYGPGGTVNVYGNATTTTYGSKTTNIPITTHRNDYGAVYFVRQKFSLGLFVRNFEDHERQKYQTNQGVVVRTVVNDTPAFFADILPGDVLLEVDGVRVPNQESFTAMATTKSGQTVELVLLRNGATLTKVVKLNP